MWHKMYFSWIYFRDVIGLECRKTLMTSPLINTHCHWGLIVQNNISWVRVMVFNVTFNNMSVILWRSVLLVEETRVHGENHRPSHWQTLSHNVLSSTRRHERDSNFQISDDRHWIHRQLNLTTIRSRPRGSSFHIAGSVVSKLTL
jgi:hypothetical protein